MDAKKAKELTKIINICKKMGVIELKFDGIEIKLSPSAIVERKRKADATPEITTPEYTEEQTLMWSVGGLPEVSNA